MSTVTVGPTSLNLNQGATQQMTATGTYNDGSTKNLTTGVVWTSSDTTVATISNSGVVTGIDVGSATITGESGTTSGTAAVTVVLANVTAITVSPTTTTVRINGGTTQAFTASATVSGSSTPVDVTSTVTWAISTTSVGTTADFTVQGQGTDSITILANSTAVAGEVATLTATYISSTSTIVANATITATN